MQQTPLPSRTSTAIPARFGAQRERVLRIMARWEATIATVTIGFSQQSGAVRCES